MFSCQIPRIRTARLLLREPRASDFEAFAADAADPVARAHLGGPRDRRDSWNRFHAAAGGWVLEGLGWWTVELPAFEEDVSVDARGPEPAPKEASGGAQGERDGVSPGPSGVVSEAGRPVGTVGVFRRETGPDAEIGWMIHRQFWGRGFASEAAGAALRHALEICQIGRVIAYVPQGNAASVRVALAIGMRAEGEADFYGERDLRFAAGAHPGDPGGARCG